VIACEPAVSPGAIEYLTNTTFPLGEVLLAMQSLKALLERDLDGRCHRFSSFRGELLGQRSTAGF